MTKEEKKLLTIAISGYYPYGLICKVGRYKRQIVEVGDGCVSINDSTPSDKHFYLTSYNFDEWTVKPFLRPLSSMTEEEAREMFHTLFNGELFNFEIEKDRVRYLWSEDNESSCHSVIFFNRIYSLGQLDFLNKKMFDYRGLIPMGLAIEATKDMYK